MSQTFTAYPGQSATDEHSPATAEFEPSGAVQTTAGDRALPIEADPEPHRKIVPVWISADPTVNAPQGCTKCATRNSSH